VNEIIAFTNGDFGSIRVVTQNGEPWFIGKDVAEILGYSNSRKALADHVDDDDKGVTKCDTLGGTQELTVINESGLYSLVLRSQMPEARQFKRWITHDVIPAIRKHGIYATPDTVEKMLEDPDSLIKILLTLKEERAARMEAEETNRINAPKVLFADSVAQAENDILVGELAKLLKQNGVETGQNRLYNKLREDGFIMKNSTIPTQRAMEMGLFRVIERSITQPNGTTQVTKTTKVTGKGQIYFVNRYATATN
jgi:anti-repressor protein